MTYQDLINELNDLSPEDRMKSVVFQDIETLNCTYLEEVDSLLGINSQQEPVILY